MAKLHLPFNFPPVLGLSALGDEGMRGRWSHLGSCSQPAPPGSGVWQEHELAPNANDPVSAAPLWHSWTLKCSCKHTDCGCGESYLGIHVSSEFLSIQSLCHLANFLFGKRQLHNWNQISDCSLLLCWDCEYREKKEEEKNLDFFFWWYHGGRK